MDFSALLTTLWNKVSKPLPNLFIGAVFLNFAPDNVKWFGYVFLAIGGAASIEWAWTHFKKEYNVNEDLKKNLLFLTNEEKKVLKPLFITKVQTHYLNINSRLDTEQGCASLKSKNIFLIQADNNDGTYNLNPKVFKILARIIKKNPDFWSIKLHSNNSDAVTIISDRTP